LPMILSHTPRLQLRLRLRPIVTHNLNGSEQPTVEKPADLIRPGDQAVQFERV
jgi:hypothetical protein